MMAKILAVSNRMDSSFRNMKCLSIEGVPHQKPSSPLERAVSQVCRRPTTSQVHTTVHKIEYIKQPALMSVLVALPVSVILCYGQG